VIETRRFRTRYAVALAVAVAAVLWLVAGPLRSNVTYFRTVSEAVEIRTAGSDERFRIMGEVVPGSVEETRQGVRFDVTDGAETASVLHRGDPPELFGEDVPVVCEGRWDGATFASDRIMIRHGNDYEPPDVDVEVDAGEGSASGDER